MSGIWNLSHVQQFDLNSQLLDGLNGRDTVAAYFYEGGTTTPMPVYQDAGLALLHPFPVQAVSARFPAVFFDDAAFSFYGVRLITGDGVQIFASVTEPIIGQQEGSGGSSVPVDLNSTLQTGDLKVRYGTGVIAGWVRVAGRSIGSASSGATERANLDTQALFLYLWAADTTLTVSGGRGVSAAADWAANKNITLPDARRAFLAGLSDMGNAALAGVAGGTTLGHPATGAVGEETHVLLTAELASHTHTPGTLAAASHRHFIAADASDNGALTNATSASKLKSTGSDSDYELQKALGGEDATIGRTSLSGTLALAGASASTGVGTAHNNLPPEFRATIYIRL